MPGARAPYGMKMVARHGVDVVDIMDVVDITDVVVDCSTFPFDMETLAADFFVSILFAGHEASQIQI